MTDLGPDFAAALILGRRFIDEPNSKRKVELLAEALKAEGDRRAAEMRERALTKADELSSAAGVEHDRTDEIGLRNVALAKRLGILELRDAIRALPLDPPETT